MAKFADLPTVEVSTEIEASPHFVWALISDINLPAQFQSEFVGAEWVDEGDVGVGSRFVGRNTRGDWNWETTSWVVEYEPERIFSWAVSNKDPSGIRRMIERNPENEEEIIAARDAEHRANMQAVIDGVKTLAESQG